MILKVPVSKNHSTPKENQSQALRKRSSEEKEAFPKVTREQMSTIALLKHLLQLLL